MLFFSSVARPFMVVAACLAALGRPNPLPVTEPQEGSIVTLVSRATPAAPHWVIYSDKWVSGENGPPAVSDIKGYNVFALSFWLISGPADQALEWTTLDSATRSSIHASYAAAGINLIVSAFGSTDAPTSTGADPTATANNLAAFVKQYGLDGADIDYEDFNAVNAQDGSAENWLTTFTQALRAQLPEGQYIITHAPVAPWFSPIYVSGAYLAVDQTVGSLIDWVLDPIVVITEGTSEYTTCTGLLNTSSSTWPSTALFQIAASGVPLNKLVIGKPATAGDANNGYMDPSTLAGCLGTAKAQGWDAGVMVWEYPDAAASWIATVRSVAFPE
ncbi:glycoside hydrolase family 18 protein [Pisolithus thermaeus]|nr:glycoside hydrolase family 18 protein [Pisolithus thermaeus]